MTSKNRIVRKSASVIVFLLAFSFVEAQIITRCGEASGHAFYFDKETGWITDSISNYELLLTYVDGEPDIIYQDATGTITSSKAGGGSVFALPPHPDFRLVMVLHTEGVMEHYLFELDENGNGTVVAGVVRMGFAAKSSIMSADCKSP